MNIIVSQEIEQVCPRFVGAAVEAQVVNSPYCAPLWEEINALGAKFREQLTVFFITVFNAPSSAPFVISGATDIQQPAKK